MKALTKKELEERGVKFLTLPAGRICGYKMKPGVKMEHEIFSTAMKMETLRKRLTEQLINKGL